MTCFISPPAEWPKAPESIFHSASFLKSIAKIQQQEFWHVPEVAFVGRSNAGKSSAINLLCQRRQLAFASKTPGRTQLINFFGLQFQQSPVAVLADLPGYGYTEMSQAARAHWDALLGTYLSERATLCSVVLVTDSRRPLQQKDVDMLLWALKQQHPVHCLLTKVDKLTYTEKQRSQAVFLAQLQEALADQFEAMTQNQSVTAQFFSASKRIGLDILYDHLAHRLWGGWVPSGERIATNPERPS